MSRAEKYLAWLGLTLVDLGLWWVIFKGLGVL